MVCKEWYNEIAWIWKERIIITLDEYWFNDFQLNATKEILTNSNRLYENIKIQLDICNALNIHQVVKIIKMFKKSIKNVIFYGNIINLRPKHIIDLLTALGNQITSIAFKSFPTVYSYTEAFFEIWNGPELEVLHGMFNNLQLLKLSHTGPKQIATFCRNLTTFEIRIMNERDGLIFDQVALKNVNLQNLCLHTQSKLNTESLVSLRFLRTLELNGSGVAYESLQKSIMNCKLNQLCSLTIDNCLLDNNDFQVRQTNFENLKVLNFKYKTYTDAAERYFIFQYCFGLPNLKELNLEMRHLNYQDHQILNKIPMNESLVDVSYADMIITQTFLREIVRSTPNLIKLSFCTVEFRFTVDKLFDLLKNLPFLEHLVLDR